MKTIKAKHTTAWPQANSRGFTLVELLIVVSILGILAAIVLPEFQGHAQLAKEAAAKDNLRILRETIERYAADHNGVPPGYPDNDQSKVPTALDLGTQLFSSSKYLSEMPRNPINQLQAIAVIPNGITITETLIANTTAGWIYHPATKTIKLNCSGTDSQNEKFFDY